MIFRGQAMNFRGFGELATNGMWLYVVAKLKAKNYDNRRTIFRST